MNTPRKLFKKRQARARTALKNVANGKLRLSVSAAVSTSTHKSLTTLKV